MVTWPDLVAETTDYYSYREALAYFLRLINLEDPEKHFPGIFQSSLFPEDVDTDATD